MGGLSRNRIAALDASGAAVAAWDPDANGLVHGLALSGSTVYAGGAFTTIGGALQTSFAGMGDATTAAAVHLVRVSAEPDRVRLEWLAAARPGARVNVHRRASATGWVLIGGLAADRAGRIVFDDRQVEAGTRYGYRLGMANGGAEELLGETWVDVPGAASARFGARPNPSFDGLSVHFSLPDASPARLELLDLAGRRVIAREVGSLGRGQHVVHMDDDGRLAPGVYLLRLASRRGALTRRVVVAR
jgi:hypothetical protein